jgi:hypothetical protein
VYALERVGSNWIIHIGGGLECAWYRTEVYVSNAAANANIQFPDATASAAGIRNERLLFWSNDNPECLKSTIILSYPSFSFSGNASQKPRKQNLHQNLCKSTKCTRVFIILASVIVSYLFKFYAISLTDPVL